MGIGVGALIALLPANALILIGTEGNTTAPTGTLAGSGWQFQGQWGNFLGTAISPYNFITSDAAGGNVGDSFVFGGVAYTTTKKTVDTLSGSGVGSDLVIWQVNKELPHYAPIHTVTDETGQSVAIFGRGAERGAAVTVSSSTRGWLWGAENHAQRWGQNQVALATDAYTGYRQIQMNFDLGGGANEATYSIGDIGGGVFIKVGSVWELAALNAGVPWSFSKTGLPGSGFDAALYDTTSLYFGDDLSGWTPEDPGTSSYYLATTISDKSFWVSVTVVPEPREYGIAAGVALAGYVILRRHARRASAPTA